MNSKKWVFKSIFTLIFSISIIAIFLYLYNMNYYFNHNLLDINESNPEERKYKTNYINNKENNYNSVLIGASSTSYINENDFDDFKVFNYSLPGMIPFEYNYVISHLEKNNKEVIENIFIGLDFFTSNHNEVTRLKKQNGIRYITESQRILYPVTELLSFYTLKNILKDYLSFLDYESSYSRWENIHHQKILNDTIVSGRIKKGIEKHKKELKEYKFYPQYKDELLSLKQKHLDKRFYIFLTPLAKPYMDLILINRLDSYTRWLEETIEVFGSIYLFPYSHSITNNYLINFRDNRHYYPSVGKKIVDSMFNNSDDQHVLLTSDNLDLYINSLESIRINLTNEQK